MNSPNFESSFDYKSLMIIDMIEKARFYKNKGSMSREDMRNIWEYLCLNFTDLEISKLRNRLLVDYLIPLQLESNKMDIPGERRREMNRLMGNLSDVVTKISMFRNIKLVEY